MPVPDYADDRPIYIQLADDLRAKISAGEYAPGDRLPSNAELSERYHVARETIRQAIDILRGEKLVVAQSTRGVFVLRELGEPEPSSEHRKPTEQIRRLEERLGEVQAEVQDHARLLARMTQRLERAGISLADDGQQDTRAM